MVIFKTLALSGMIGMSATVAFAKECNDYDTMLEVLALNMYHEARGDGMDGMQMVGEVTLNRVSDYRFPNDVCEVVYQKHQFSWVKQLEDHTPHNKKLWNATLELAESLIADEVDYMSNGATYFLNPDAVDNLPRWAREFELVGKVGNHVFYKDS